jgi:hypothetical protein
MSAWWAAQLLNLHAASKTARLEEFNATFPSTATHTVKVVVVGTAGHPDVDIDAFAVLA